MKKYLLLIVVFITYNIAFGQKIPLPHVNTKVIEVDVPAIHPDCNEDFGHERLTKCLHTNLYKDILEEFNYDIISELKLRKIDVIRIETLFTINKEGNINNIRPYIQNKMRKKDILILEEEIIRILNMLPLLKPAILNEEAVDIDYSLPIAIRVS